MSEFHHVDIAAWLFIHDDDGDIRENRPFNGTVTVGPFSQVGNFDFGYTVDDTVTVNARVAVRDTDQPGVIEYCVGMAMYEDGDNTANLHSPWYSLGPGASTTSPKFTEQDDDENQMHLTVTLKNHVMQVA